MPGAATGSAPATVYQASPNPTPRGASDPGPPPSVARVQVKSSCYRRTSLSNMTSQTMREKNPLGLSADKDPRGMNQSVFPIRTNPTESVPARFGQAIHAYDAIVDRIRH